MKQTLFLYDTLAKEKREFAPIDDRTVSMYVCGPTVYNYVHIGNARPAVVFDVLFRVLKRLYPKVVYARNITDIDDKIIRAAREQGKSTDAIALKFSAAYSEDMAALNTLPPSLVPLATKNIEAMISLIEQLVRKGHAYTADNHVLFSVESMDDYGALSGRKLDDMLAGARVEVADYKRHPGDFVLWKPSTGDDPGWDSPFGFGRPGWHLECSAMIREHLGPKIDIHGGGRDLCFPHHENEIAQSRCAFDSDSLAAFWLHNGFINLDGEKMSKSLGNVKTVRDLLEQYPGEVLRYALMTAQYRSDMDFSKDLLEQSKKSLDSVYSVLASLEHIESSVDEPVPVSSALLNDLNTCEAISELHALIKLINRELTDRADTSELKQLKHSLLSHLDLLGLGSSTPELWFAHDLGEDEEARINQLVAERVQAKQNKDWQRADEIREQLAGEGIILEDKAGETSWKLA